jgi:hypothetical protein
MSNLISLEKPLEKPREIDLFDERRLHEIARQIKSLPQRCCPTTHYFGPGIYVRQMLIPPNTVAIGHYHTTEHLCSLIMGRMMFFPDADNYQIHNAPHTFLSAPGHKRVYALSYSMVQNIFPNPDNIRDLDELEDLFVDKSMVPVDLLPSYNAEADRRDFAALNYHAVGPDRYYELPPGFETALGYRKSPIHGKGVFLSIAFGQGEYIAPYRIDRKYTMLAKYLNHSRRPNCRLVKTSSGNIHLVASRYIMGCVGDSLGEELTINYREVPS